MVLRLKGKGVGGNGDQFVKLQIMPARSGGRGITEICS